MSNAFLKSMKLMTRSFWCSRLCSMIFRSAKIYSVHDRLFLKPACSSRKVWSTAFCSLLSSTLVKTLPGADNRVIHLQLLQSLRLPFLGSFKIIPSFQSSGTSCSRQMLLNSTTSCPVIESGSKAGNKEHV